MKHVLLLVALAVPVLAALVYGGSRLLWAGRQLDEASTETSTLIPVAPTGSVAAKVDARLQRTRAAVETLVMPEVASQVLHPSASASRERAQTYSVLGAGLLGLAATLLIGVLLVL